MKLLSSSDQFHGSLSVGLGSMQIFVMACTTSRETSRRERERNN
jgi:hypothetical protein